MAVGSSDAARELVLQIAAQNAVFDQHVALRLVAFVVDVERAAAAADGAVVDDGAERACHLLADAPAEGRNALAIEIGFEAVADGFVQQDAGPAGAQHHGLFARRSIHGVELNDGLARGFGAKYSGVRLVQEKIELIAAAAARVALLRNAVAVRGRARSRSCAPAAGDRNSERRRSLPPALARRLSA